jgi:hypothetical protein
MSIDEMDLWYYVLDLEPGASFEEVKNRWRVLSQIWHPDRHPAGSQAYKMALEKQKQVNNAYDHLKRWFEAQSSSVPPPQSSSASPPRSSSAKVSPLPPADAFTQASAAPVASELPAFYLALKEFLYRFYVFMGIDKSPVKDEEPLVWAFLIGFCVLWVRRMTLALIVWGLFVIAAPTYIGIPIVLWLIWHFTFDLRPEFQRRSIIESPYMFSFRLTEKEALDSIAATLASESSAGNKWGVAATNPSQFEAKLKYVDSGKVSEIKLLATVFVEPPFCLVKLEFCLEGCGATPLAESIVSYCVPKVRRNLESAQDKS